MPATPSAPADPATAAPRIVFFGPPNSGKTHLLRAVAAVAGAGAEEPPVELTHADDGPAGAALPLEVMVDLPGPAAETGGVLLLDCDGRAAAELLNHPDALTRQQGRDRLQDAIRRADAIVVAIDAQWPDDELRANFALFKVFLESLEGARVFGREAGGLPVFLALTKCDALLRPGEDRTPWLGRVTARQAEVLDHFQDEFDDRLTDFGFGTLELHSAATATRMPDGQPFGVDALVAELLPAAKGYRDRDRQTGRRLKYTLGGLAAGLGAAILGMGLLAAFGPPGPARKLAADVEAYRAREGPPALRLADGAMPGNRRVVESFLASAYFPELPAGPRDFLVAREREFEAYREFRDRFRPPQFSPAEVRTAGELQKLAADLDGPLAPPAEYAATWADTEAVRLREKWRRDADLLRAAEDETHGWYRGLIRRATDLMLVEAPSADWRDAADALFREAGRVPYPPEAAVPGSPVVGVRRGEPLTYTAAYRYERTESAERDWALAARKLRDLADLCEALGMIPAGEGRPPAVLVMPKGSGKSLPQAAERLEMLKRFYPAAFDGSADWAASHFPDPIRRELTHRLRVAAERGIQTAHFLIRSELYDVTSPTQNFSDAPGDWAKLNERFLVKPEFRAWGTLLQKIHAWADLSPTNPVEELADFLKRDRFAWPVEKLELYLPDALHDQVLAPDGNFTITVTPKDGPPRATLFGDAKSTRTDGQGTTWQFTAAPRTPPITYELGSAFVAEMTLRSGNARFTLDWTEGRTNTFQFDRLAERASITRIEARALGRLATGVKLTVLPESAAIRVPELLPRVRSVK